ncbi:MAG TPA: trypsin-like peptidase domain-containing protein [Candidatus Limnocylindria bacterium]|nr:trypsin-like peptidase domain-containing protein [Candidatus Limnocylindria bacterium]
MNKIILPLLLSISAFAEVPENISEFPVQIEIGGSMGSGFFVMTSNRVFLVTAKHVLFDIASTNRSLPLRGSTLSFSAWSKAVYGTATYNIQHYYTNNEVRFSNDRDVAVVHFCDLVGTNKILGFELDYVTVNPNTNWFQGMPYEQLRKIRDLSVAEDAYTFGYPVSIGSALPGKRQLDSTRPLARKGIISDVDLRRNVIVIDMPVYFGNSGGPVLTVQKVRNVFPDSYHAAVVGIVSQFIPFEDVWVSQRYNLPNVSWSNSGYAVVEPIDSVIALLW